MPKGKPIKRSGTDANSGRLRIFFGMAAGVGKTYSMLTVAQQLKKEGVDVVVAYAESHGRMETDALLQGLEVLPKAMIEYQGVLLPELDIDAVLLRNPRVALVDELAHSNAPGSRHEKRWEDVPDARRVRVEQAFALARMLNIETSLLQARDVARTLVDFARERHITQLYMGRAVPLGWRELFQSNVVERVIRRATEVDVHVVADR